MVLVAAAAATEPVAMDMAATSEDLEALSPDACDRAPDDTALSKAVDGTVAAFAEDASSAVLADAGASVAEALQHRCVGVLPTQAFEVHVAMALAAFAHPDALTTAQPMLVAARRLSPALPPSVPKSRVSTEFAAASLAPPDLPMPSHRRWTIRADGAFTEQWSPPAVIELYRDPLFGDAQLKAIRYITSEDELAAFIDEVRHPPKPELPPADAVEPSEEQPTLRRLE